MSVKSNLMTALAGVLLLACSSVRAQDSFVYVSNEDSNDISVISSASQQEVARIPVGKRPRGIKISPDGKKAYVALSGSPKCPPTMPDEECESMVADKSADGIAEVNTLSRQVVRILPSGSDPEQFDVDWQKQRLFVSNEDSNQASILDLQGGEIIATAATGREPEGVRLTPDGSAFYVTGEVDSDITVLDAGSGAVIAKIQVGTRPRDIIFSADGSRAYVSAEFGATIAVVDAGSHSLISEIALPEGSLPMGLVLAPDAGTLFVANGRARTVTAVDLATEKVTASVEVGARPWGLGTSLDGKYLYSANGPSDNVSVIDIESFSVIATIAVGETPWGIAVGPAP